MGWGWLSLVTGGLAGSVLTLLVQHFKGSRAAKSAELKRAELRAYAGKHADLYRENLDTWQKFGGTNGQNSAHWLNAARAALETAAKAYRNAGDEVNGLELEKEARGWELLHALPPAPDPLAEQRAGEVKIRLLGHAKEQETLYKHHWETWRAMGSVNTKNRTFHIQRAASHAEAAAKAYREAGDVVSALKWEQSAKNTIP